MKTHRLTERKTYPKHHFWAINEIYEDCCKLNVFSVKPIDKGDRIEFNGVSYKVKSAKHAPTEYSINTLFYELDLVKC